MLLEVKLHLIWCLIKLFWYFDVLLKLVSFFFILLLIPVMTFTVNDEYSETIPAKSWHMFYIVVLFVMIIITKHKQIWSLLCCSLHVIKEVATIVAHHGALLVYIARVYVPNTSEINEPNIEIFISRWNV